MSSVIEAASALKAQQISDKAEVSVAKKGLDVAKTQGESAVQLIDAAAVSATTGKGANLDVEA